MKLTRQDQHNLLSFFPKIELSYIKNIHKKVHSDVYLIIPKGYKFFAWFKCWNNENVCFIMQVDSRTKSISQINIYSSAGSVKCTLKEVVSKKRSVVRELAA